MLPNPGAGRVSSSTEQASQAAMSTCIAQSFCPNASINISFITLLLLFGQWLALPAKPVHNKVGNNPNGKGDHQENQLYRAPRGPRRVIGGCSCCVFKLIRFHFFLLP